MPTKVLTTKQNTNNLNTTIKHTKQKAIVQTKFQAKDESTTKTNQHTCKTIKTTQIQS